MLASNVLMTAGTPGHMYLDERHEKCLQRTHSTHVYHFKQHAHCTASD